MTVFLPILGSHSRQACESTDNVRAARRLTKESVGKSSNVSALLHVVLTVLHSPVLPSPEFYSILLCAFSDIYL